MQIRVPKIRPAAGAIRVDDYESCTHLALLVAADGANLRTLPWGDLIAERMRRAGHKLGDAKPFLIDLPNPAGTRLAIAGLPADTNAFDRLTLARKLVGAQLEQNPAKLMLASHALGDDETNALEALVAAALAADFELPHFKSGDRKPRALRELIVRGTLPAATLARTIAGARGNNLARYLTVLPPNELTPGNYRRRTEQLARANRWQSEFIDLKKLRRLGAGAFIAVAQGSPEADAGILRLRYTPRKRTRHAGIALVGKGICFDTGGTNLKSAKHMQGMHEDMEGSAVALGTLLALSELKVDFPVECWLALAQNHIGPKAYRQNEVVKAANGTTIEIVHTDAEGRMVLADTLTLATRAKPKLVIDYATLTGSCVGALSTRLSGVLTNRPALIAKLIQAGDASGERVWPFPLPADFAEVLKSDVADVKQCTIDSEADHILAALFLKRFLNHDPDWIHVDLAAGNHKGGLAHIPTDTTGFGVRFTLNLLLDQKLAS
ncbi:MAG: leucyl aminopeptidase family protein [Gammaproteobacteria bacterium]|nr:leucyl aminopeptidase family protein [Gammaproteobacteria bacterium]